MSRVVGAPVDAALRPDGMLPAGWWHDTDEVDRIVCDLCPRECHLKPGDRGFCFVRANQDGQMVLTTYGRSTGFCIDPIEKKPLNHFFPGTSVLSFGTAGCNLGCKFCQNWDISKSREVDRLSELALPQTIANAANQLGCKSVAFTYNDPVVWAEYAIDTAKACRQVGIHTVAVTAGYVSPPAREPFFEHMDAANVDLKAFSEEFYHKITYSHLQPVLDTLEWVHRETDVWLEITNLLIPGANDQPDEIRRMCHWLLARVGDEIPLHLTAFHPDYRMLDRPRTPHATLLAAQQLAIDEGLKHVYIGNVNDVAHQSTDCPACQQPVIERRGYELGNWNLRGNCCAHCGSLVAGRFEAQPGNWGAQRRPIQISDFAPSLAEGTTIAPQPVPTPSARTTAMPDFASLDSADTDVIHSAAGEMIVAEVTGVRARSRKSAPLLSGLMVEGAFTTLKRRGRLRACCGSLGKAMAWEEALRLAAGRTATHDPRFPAVAPSELPFLDLDVTLLHGFQPVSAVGRQRVDAVQVGKHGVQIHRGEASGLLLPVVAIEQGWDAETLLTQVCRKAGLSSDAWQESSTQLTTFEGCSVCGPLDAVLTERYELDSQPPFSPDAVCRMAEHGRANLARLLQGATPDYYLADCPDGTVSGVAVQLELAGKRAQRTFSQWSLRPGLPLQATLFRLIEAAAGWLRGERITLSDLSQARLGLAVLTSPAMHGTVDQPDLRGIDSTLRGVLVSEQSQAAWIFDREQSAAELLESAVQAAQLTTSQTADVYSLRVVSTVNRLSAVRTAPSNRALAVRPPAVAGSFYPADARALTAQVDGFLGAEVGVPEAWPAMMVPHAGLIYSGQIAAQVFRRVRIPSTVIILGPKHTRLGARWALAPHERWQLPSGTMAADLNLVRHLSAEIPELQLDAAAHEREHCIEVELPFLIRLAPAAKVVGIVLGGGSLSSCFEFAAALARVIGSLDEPPLLVISSDMNHYAGDEENRRLDELALQAMESLDPAILHRRVVENEISMCGLLPAVVVMDTLRRLGQLSRIHRVAYGTSADVNNDREKVVGYAGMLLG